MNLIKCKSVKLSVIIMGHEKQEIISYTLKVLNIYYIHTGMPLQCFSNLYPCISFGYCTTHKD